MESIIVHDMNGIIDHLELNNIPLTELLLYQLLLHMLQRAYKISKWDTITNIKYVWETLISEEDTLFYTYFTNLGKHGRNYYYCFIQMIVKHYFIDEPTSIDYFMMMDDIIYSIQLREGVENNLLDKYMVVCEYKEFVDFIQKENNAGLK
jgi:hypothetical protein